MVVRSQSAVGCKIWTKPIYPQSRSGHVRGFSRGTQATTTATATKTSLKKWSHVASNFIAKEKKSLCLMFTYASSTNWLEIRWFSRRSRAVEAKMYQKKYAARVELLFYSTNLMLFFCHSRCCRRLRFYYKDLTEKETAHESFWHPGGNSSPPRTLQINSPFTYYQWFSYPCYLMLSPWLHLSFVRFLWELKKERQ